MNVKKSTDLEPNMRTIKFLGNFGVGNSGNESTLQAILHHLRRVLPNAEVTCICTGPAATAATHNITAVPISPIVVKAWTPQNRLTRLLRSLCIGIPCELYRWLEALVTLKDTDVLIIPGTGLLTDAYGLRSWGPYNVFKWSLIAKVRGCKLLFVSVGGGPIYSRLGRFFVKSALALADFRSYRDPSTMDYLRGIGFQRKNDRVYPDLAFSLPEAVIPPLGMKTGKRSVVGLGLMDWPGRYSVDGPGTMIYRRYLENLVSFVKWLLVHEYDVRLLIGDSWDKPVVQEFRSLLKERSAVDDVGLIIDEPVLSVKELLLQLAETDIVVATRFHNVLLGLLCNKPVISISFHHKCVSLMSSMGLSEYCLDIKDLKADALIEKLCDIEKEAAKLRRLIREKAERFREALDEQYGIIFKEI